MGGRMSRLRAVLTIIGKDLKMMTRELIFVFMTVLSLVIFVTLYWVLPDRADDTISLGIHGQGVRTALAAYAGETEAGLGIAVYPDTESLRAAVDNREIEVGLDFPDELVQQIAAGNRVTVTVFARPNLPVEITDALSSMVREVAYAAAGHLLPVSEPDEEMVVLGFDRSGQQLAMRDRLRPLYAFMMLIMEAVALGGLIAAEIQHKTVIALMATPARLSDILLAKGIVGTLLAFGEASLMLLLIRGFGPVPGVVVVALFLGAVMVTGVAMIAGAAGKDLMATMLIGIGMLIPLAIPGFAILLPGAAAGWVRAMPTYSLVDTIVRVNFYNQGWSDVLGQLGLLAAWCVAIATVGILVLRGRVKRI